MRNKGQTLIEVLVGFTAMVLIIGAITMLSISALNNAQFAKNQSLATQYAQQGIEMIRNQRDTDYGTFKSLSSHLCLADSCTAPVAGNNSNCGGAPTCSINVLSAFRRDVTIIPLSPDCGLDGLGNPINTKVTVGVSWTDGKCTGNSFCHTEQVTSCFSDFFESQPTPTTGPTPTPAPTPTPTPIPTSTPAPTPTPTPIPTPTSTPTPTPICNHYALVSGSVSPSTVSPGGSVNVSCDYGAIIDCISPSSSGYTGCTYTGFSGNAAQFTCPVTTTTGSYTNVCNTFTGSFNNCCASGTNAGSFTVQ